MSSDPSDKPDIARTVTAALPVALLLPFVAGLAGVLKSVVSSPRFSGAALFTVLVAPLLLGFVALTRRRLPRAGVLAAVHALAWSPVIALLASQAVTETIVSGPLPGGMRCGTGLMGFLFLAVPVGAVALFLGGIALGLGFARRATDNAIRVGAFIGVALAFIAVLFALPRLGRPDADTYLSSLDTITEIAPRGEAVVLGRTLRSERVTIAPAPEPRPVPSAGDPDPDIGPMNPDPPPPRIECHLTGLADMQQVYTTDGECPPIRVRADARRDLVVLEWESNPEIKGSWSPRIAFRPASGMTTAISGDSIADRTAPPIGWIVGAAVGAMLGLGLYLAGHRIRRRAAQMAGVEAEHLGLGLVRLPSGESVTVDAAASLLIGPIVLTDRTDHAPTYRATGAPTFSAAFAGRLADLRAVRVDLAASLQASALALATLGATPLIVARILGAF